MKVVLQNVTKKFPSRDKKFGKEVTAVRNMSFEIPDGKLVGLLGPSGCGKSTTLNMISGLEDVTKGKIFFGDEDVTNLPPEKRGIGLVFQNYALYPHLTVKENIMFPLENLKGEQKLIKEVMEEKVLETAKLVQIEKYLDRKPAELSGGQQQRVAIARALVKRPRILLLDEPLSNLDARLRLQTREELRRIQRETGITTIFVTHDQEEAMSISDFIVVMKEAVIQQIGVPQSVYDAPDNLFVARFLGNPQINTFNGTVTNGRLMLGNDYVLDVEGVPDQAVTVGIRPEGFSVNPEGPMHCVLERIEVMGRDTSILSGHKACYETRIRSIVNAREAAKVGEKEVRYSLLPEKVYLFDKMTEKRIDCKLSW